MLTLVQSSDNPEYYLLERHPFCSFNIIAKDYSF